MSNEPQKPAAKIVAKQEEAPCGCQSVFYSDGTGEHKPCVPCALIQAGHLLAAAGNRLGHEIQQAKSIEAMRRKLSSVRSG